MENSRWLNDPEFNSLLRQPWQFDIDLSDSVFINSLYDGTRDHVRISVPINRKVAGV